MQSTKELFDIDPTIFKQMSYPNVLLLKSNKLKLLLEQELNKDYLIRDYQKMAKITKASKNITKLLNELNESN